MEWVDIITRVGFPIAMCIALCWYINKKDERTDKILTELTVAVTELKTQLADLLRKEE